MICKHKNVECEHAGTLTFFGSKFCGDPDDDRHEWALCYNDEIGRDITKCKRQA